MVSESVSWPVNMIIGALKEFFLRMRTASRPSMSGSPTSMMTRSTWLALAACTPLAPVSVEIASNSSCSDNCSTSASRSSVSSSTIRILRAVAMRSLGGQYWLPRLRQVQQSTRKAQAQLASHSRSDDGDFSLSVSYASDNACKYLRAYEARQSRARLAVGRMLAHQGGTRPFRHQGQQAGRGWRNPGRALSAGPVVVAPGSPAPAADAVAGEADKRPGRLV